MDATWLKNDTQKFSASCKMLFRRVGLRSIGPSNQKLWPNQMRCGWSGGCSWNQSQLQISQMHSWTSLHALLEKSILVICGSQNMWKLGRIHNHTLYPLDLVTFTGGPTWERSSAIKIATWVCILYSLSRIMAMEAEEKCRAVRMLNSISQNSSLDNKWFWWWCVDTSWSVFTLKSWRLSGHKNFSLCCADIVGSLRNLKRVTMWWWPWHSKGPSH